MAAVVNVVMNLWVQKKGVGFLRQSCNYQFLKMNVRVIRFSVLLCCYRQVTIHVTVFLLIPTPTLLLFSPAADEKY